MAKDTTDKGLFSRLGGHYGGGGYGYPPSYGYNPCPYSGGYGYPPAGYPPPPPPQAAYPPVAYPYAAHNTHQYSGYGGSHMGPMLAGGAAAAYGMHHLGHGGHRYGHGHHGYGHGHHGYGHHGKFKHGKFGKHWKHGMFHGKFKKWK